MLNIILRNQKSGNINNSLKRNIEREQADVYEKGKVKKFFKRI